jgi:hypothetical protein
MKNYILVILLLMGSVVHAQSNVVTNRLVVKDSLSLNGNWISQINQDSTLQFAGPNSVSTDGAIRKFIQQAVHKPAAGKGIRADSVLTIDPATRQIAMSKLAAGGSISTTELVDKTLFNRHALRVNFDNALPDSLSCLVTSSDGQVTSFIMQAKMSDYIYAPGIPPFTLKADVPHVYPTLRMTVGLGPYSNYIDGSKMLNGLQWSPNYGDTVHMEMTNLVWDVNFQTYLRDTTGDYGYKNVEVNYKNNSDKLTIVMQYDRIVPGVKHSFRDFQYLPAGRTNSIDFKINKMVSSANSVQRGVIPEVPYRIRIYKNGSLYYQEAYAPGINWNSYNFVIDDSWNSYDIVLDDM